MTASYRDCGTGWSAGRRRPCQEQRRGHSVLDIARAARWLEPKIGNKLLIAGHSQGGHVALFAARLAKSGPRF